MVFILRKKQFFLLFMLPKGSRVIEYLFCEKTIFFIACVAKNIMCVLNAVKTIAIDKKN